MKLLDRKKAQSDVKLQNDNLIIENIRLRKLWQEITHRLNTIRETYEPEKLKRLDEFEKFCKEILEKKSILFQELKGIEMEIEKKKEVYFNMIDKQDVLDEKIYQMREQEKKLDMREAFVGELEKKQRELSVK